ncbi:hypothetical protein KZZ52_53955 [Dactylosporangium sp. AC04546]|uniref:hypothetical protein n=1 Tax=Dactylosporangium sp. AC04546 TaxID=2862460 RepID=UPI002E7B810C|nr:hypothetical protein [Dactylosporangium sp. AC04546]WVK82761.1 hypothetical protein KZZ52_53955 [Dactylosporangium sp. AC04546]
MRGGRWIVAIGAWTACVGAISAAGIGKMEDVRSALLESTARRSPAGSPAASPSPSASGAAPRVLTSPGGSVIAHCEREMVWVEWLSPADGFRVQDATQGPAKESHVTFKTDGREVRLVVRCTDTGPTVDVTLG